MRIKVRRQSLHQAGASGQGDSGSLGLSTEDERVRKEYAGMEELRHGGSAFFLFF